ncbi:MAG: LacI family DNA-binding transcriptional regulator [Phycisphaerales bacterium]
MSVSKVANLAGVSPATVSKVINRYPSVSAENTQRVRAAMRQLNYRPATRRRRVVQGPVAVLILHVNQFHHFTSSCSLMLQGVENELRAREQDMVIAHVSSVEHLPAIVRKRQVSGLILIGHLPSQAVLKQINDIPSVWLTSHHDVGGDVMLSGNEAVGRIAAEYLIERGHKKLGVLNTLGQNPVVDVRCRYFAFVAQEHGCTTRSYISGHDMTWDGQRELGLDDFERQVGEQIDVFLSDGQRPTGLFVPLDLQVAMVYRVLDKRGVKPGKGLEIIGSDDEKAALIGLNPRPATVNIGPVTMGRRAVEQLFWRIDHGESDRQVCVTVVPMLVPGD